MTEFGEFGLEGAPNIGPSMHMPIEPVGGSALPAMNIPNLPPLPESSVQLMEEVLHSTYRALEDRVITNPTPTAQELDLGVYVEEIQPQVREAALQMRDKGYDNGNVMHAGFSGETYDEQSMTLNTDLSAQDIAMLAEQGVVVADGRISFEPADKTDLGSIKSTWDWIAQHLPDRGEPVGPATFGNAVAFREAAANGTLLDYYLPEGELDMIGVKYVAKLDPWAETQLFLSPDAVSAMREMTYIDLYHELRDRLAADPAPTAEELNMGAYVQELEPQVRDAVMSMRRKGYDTGSSGFYGQDHADQSMDIATPLDNETKAYLAKHRIEVTDRGVRFRPDNPSNLTEIKATWDMIAESLPDLGRHADPAQNSGADMFRYATGRESYGDYLECWIWQTGALAGAMTPLAITLVNEGRDFGGDPTVAMRAAEAHYNEIRAQAARERINAELDDDA